MNKTHTRWQPVCPQSGQKGKPVQLITLKSLLIPHALEQLSVGNHFAFCPDPVCPIVYFSEEGQSFDVTDLKAPVFQKETHESVPVCYCFGWSRQRIQEELQGSQTGERILNEITAHIRAKRCGCEVNNPQGSCCLGNVRQVISKIIQDKTQDKMS